MTSTGATTAVRRGDIFLTGPQEGAHRIADLIALGREALHDEVDAWSHVEPDIANARVLAPVDGRTEIWAAGVTYVRSREARKAESHLPDVYELVYDAERPELFFKSVAWRVVGPEASIAIRRDSAWNVPEPELAVVCNAAGQIVGYTICNDVSSRSIEGENPLYLPQAKVYRGACAVGPAIVPWWDVPDPYDLEINLRIHRDGALAWAGQTSTSQLHRRLDDLVDYLFREETFPDGVILSTGTGIVPPDSVTLQPGDLVEIGIDHIGTLRNRVVAGKDDVNGSP